MESALTIFIQSLQCIKMLTLADALIRSFSFTCDSKSLVRTFHGIIRSINVLTWLRGFQDKIAIFKVSCISINEEDLDTKKTPPNKDQFVLGAMLEY